MQCAQNLCTARVYHKILSLALSGGMREDICHLSTVSEPRLAHRFRYHSLARSHAPTPNPCRKIWNDHDEVLRDALASFIEVFEANNKNENELHHKSIELFNAYDLDLSGGIDEEEFRDLVGLLYPDLSIRQTAECMKAVRPIFGPSAGVPPHRARVSFPAHFSSLHVSCSRAAL